MKIDLKDTLNFKKTSKDNNKIHYDKNFSSKFFFKEPIIHGINAAILSLNHFFKKEKKNYFLNKLNINFINFILVNEEFKIKLKKRNILVFNKLNEKIKIDLDFIKIKKKNKKLIKINIQKITKELLFVSKYIGSKFPGNGSLIHKIIISMSLKKISSRKIRIRKIIKNIYNIKMKRDNLEIEIIASKLQAFIPKNKKISISKANKKLLRNKKILLFGSSGDLAKRINLLKEINNCKIINYSFRIKPDNTKILNFEKRRLFNKIKFIKPDFIFYLSSPKIYAGDKKNSFLFKFYKVINVDYLKLIINVILQQKLNTKVFYPSTFALNNKKSFRRLDCYTHSKKMVEQFSKKSKIKNKIKTFRLPQYQSRSNYNMLGFYEGLEAYKFDKFLNSFFNWTKV